MEEGLFIGEGVGGEAWGRCREQDARGGREGVIIQGTDMEAAVKRR